MWNVKFNEFDYERQKPIKRLHERFNCARDYGGGGGVVVGRIDRIVEQCQLV